MAARLTVVIPMYNEDLWENPPAAVLHQYAIFYGKRRAISWRAGASEEMDFRPANLSFR